MKKLYKRINQLFLYSSIFILSLFNSCIPQPQTTLQAYYSFDENDIDKLLDIELYQEISYQDGTGETLTYYVEYVTDDYKIQYITGGGAFLGFPVPKGYKFYHDRKRIEFSVNQGMYDFEYKFERYPIDFEQALSEPYVEHPSEFRGHIFFLNWNGVGTWNGVSGSDDLSGIAIDYETEILTMTIDDIMYENVYVIESGNPNPLVNGVIIRTVNVLYYDLYYGIIGFDEVDGREWRINTSE